MLAQMTGQLSRVIRRRPRPDGVILLIFACSWLVVPRGVAAQDDGTAAANPSVPAPWEMAVAVAGADSQAVEKMPADIQPLIMALILEAIPTDYDNRKKWGGTREIWDGLHVRLDGAEIKTKRRKKTVNHGQWSRYHITLVEPQKNVRVTVSNVRRLETGEAAFDLQLEAKLDVLGQAQQWNRGVRVWSLSSEATADVRVLLACSLATRLDITAIPPDLVFDPHVTEAKLQLADLKLRRVSDADGPLVRELSWSVEKFVREELDDRNDKLTGKLNRQIDKNRDKLRLSASRFVKDNLLSFGTESAP
jgi:hypothetical protein